MKKLCRGATRGRPCTVPLISWHPFYRKGGHRSRPYRSGVGRNSHRRRNAGCMKTLSSVPARLALLIALLLLWAAPARFEQNQPADAFEVRDVMIPMRDGARLHTK